MRCTSVVIADQYPVVLQGLSSALSAERDFKIVARCIDGTNCLDAIRRFAPDIAILDFSILDMSWREILSAANAANVATRIVFFTASVEEEDWVALVEAGAYAVIPKDAEPDILVQTLRQVADGQRLLPRSSSPLAPREMSTIAEKGLASLTGRQRQIMHLVSAGLSNKEIGRRLNIADGTIKVHLHNIFQKLEISNRTALAAFAISQSEGFELVSGGRLSIES
ncbi:response regulator transcription factor [Bradyrhizobium sp. ISRA443]|uniref:LuxR C-terminal-related transcriptional regulator n=1 Tax=unclassified Bradyrhizobium TaxID=2631580 RepID=UPI0024795E22|nr:MULTISPECIES: response regulator transcription factor [unclassified Bradyrhizobium]WGS01444.1 response regulator transcription factor [Bradyrhizobium sp. ISRA436]WGS08331.1 response regulator transcription factor [Bradyrhizobium sp. ISRA437]WGS15219.1 response regulator transcription factor [Bradyrhizobium sp. ISRA443]